MTRTQPILRTIFLAAALAMTAALSACGNSPDTMGITPANALNAAELERVFVVTSRTPSPDRNVLFSAVRSPALHFADITVSVPPKRQTGEIVFPRRKPDLSRQFAAASIAVTDDESLMAERLKAELAFWPEGRRTVFVYVHGYNTSFASGLFRHAQLSHDYGMQGVSLNYSWPSAGKTSLYLYDRDSADFARAGLVRTLRIAEAAGPDNIVLIAHSMGTLLTMEALRELSISGSGHILRRIEALVLASPDIDMDLFSTQLSSFTARPGVIVAIVSAKDRALQVSSGARGGQSRLGQAANREALEQLGVKVIDSTNFKDQEGSAGHHAFASSPTMIRMLANSGLGIGGLARSHSGSSADEGLGSEGLSAIERLKRKITGG